MCELAIDTAMKVSYANTLIRGGEEVEVKALQNGIVLLETAIRRTNALFERARKIGKFAWVLSGGRIRQVLDEW